MITIKDRYPAVERAIARVRERFADEPRVGDTFQNCISDTLKRTIHPRADGLVDVITGDIPAMWLRDSACQLSPFIRLAKEEPELMELLSALSRRHAALILMDPYANAFNVGDRESIWMSDGTDMKPFLWERKYEIDSLCHPVRMAWQLWKATGHAGHLDESWRRAFREILRVFTVEQRHESLSDYRFTRRDCRWTDTLSRDGRGALVKEGIGLIFSGFRPSDDACVYGYLIPSNMQASVCLGHMAEIARDVFGDPALAAEADAMSRQVRAAVEQYGIVPVENFYAYEVDGFGQYNIMDDANLPSLLSMPYMGWCDRDDPAYLNTRRMALSSQNPFFYSGRYLKGVGSPHTPPDYAWDIAIAMQGLTAADREEQLACIRAMAQNDGGTGLMHEGVMVDDPTRYTRPWFSWANSMYCELVMEYCGI